MRRKAFILTEILTGMTLQTIFALTLFGAFYMLLTFSTSTHQILAAHDEGQLVISYVDARIRNVGLGLFRCESIDGVVRAFDAKNNFWVGTADNIEANLPLKLLPLALIKREYSGEDMSEYEDDISYDEDTGIYEGNIITMLYAHKDYKNNHLIVTTNNMEAASVDKRPSSSTSSTNVFTLIQGREKGLQDYMNSNFSTNDSASNIAIYAATESTGLPLRLSYQTESDGKTAKAVRISAAMDFLVPKVKIYPMSELLNIECVKLFCAESIGGRSFKTSTLGYDGYNPVWNNPLPHTKGILEIYGKLETKPEVPIFTLKVLVSEGELKNGEESNCPQDWPSGYWRSAFKAHKLHVSQASWKLYNLAPLDLTYHED